MTGSGSWFGHDPARWEEFRARYRMELRGREDLMARLREKWSGETVMPLSATRDRERNNAVVVREELER